MIARVFGQRTNAERIIGFDEQLAAHLRQVSIVIATTVESIFQPAIGGNLLERYTGHDTVGNRRVQKAAHTFPGVISEVDRQVARQLVSRPSAVDIDGPASRIAASDCSLRTTQDLDPLNVEESRVHHEMVEQWDAIE